jgi:hypothetical protein
VLQHLIKCSRHARHLVHASVPLPLSCFDCSASAACTLYSDGADAGLVVSMKRQLRPSKAALAISLDGRCLCLQAVHLDLRCTASCTGSLYRLCTASLCCRIELPVPCLQAVHAVVPAPCGHPRCGVSSHPGHIPQCGLHAGGQCSLVLLQYVAGGENVGVECVCAPDSLQERCPPANFACGSRLAATHTPCPADCMVGA